VDITTRAEALGLDYVFGMAKWRGFGGSTGLWDSSVRIRLIGTVTPILFHPAYLAKVAATIDDISNGRLGLNIVTGALLGEYTQMGGLPEQYDENRYAYATEWVQVLKRLWSEPRVTHHGRYCGHGRTSLCQRTAGCPRALRPGMPARAL
jgi:pyrimidine oxygenase